MKDTRINLNETSSHEITTFPLGYYLENDLVPSSRDNAGRTKAFEEFDKNWKQLVSDNEIPSSEPSYTESELDSDSSDEDQIIGR